MPVYFSKFPKTYYSFGPNGSGLDIVTNIISRFTIEEDLKNNSSVYYEYNIADGETPETIASKIYGSSERHWMILMMNDIVDPQFDWPLQEQTLMKYIDEKYRANSGFTSVGSGINWAKTNIQSYYLIINETTSFNEVEKELEVDSITYANNDYMKPGSSSNFVLDDGTNLTVSFDKKTISYFDYEVRENENKRNIIVLKREFVNPLENELKRVFSE
jgi:hypothetical protein